MLQIIHSKTFRIFVSSTFSDFKEERDALQRHVFSHLQKLCEKNGCRFQVIDLRWGVSENAAYDQRTIQICLKEIERCQTITPRPNFIFLIGEKYGWQPLPPEIPEDEYDAIYSILTQSEKAILKFISEDGIQTDWYRKDSNSIPPIYVLQPRFGKFKDYSIWQKECEEPIRKIFRQKVLILDFPELKRKKYFISATEAEIIKGVFSTSDAIDHVFCGFKTIKNINIDNNTPFVSTRVFKDFFDTTTDGVIDLESRKLLLSLKNRLIRDLKSRIFHYQAEWKDTVIDTPYILPFNPDNPNNNMIDEEVNQPSLCKDVWDFLSKVILSEIKKIENESSLDKEINAHLEFLKSKEFGFIRREEIELSISRFLNTSSVSPLLLLGQSGSGKTAFIANMISWVKKTYPQHAIIVRTIGATPSSSDLISLLSTISEEISMVYGITYNNQESDPNIVKNAFMQLLHKASSEKPLIIIIDALNQLQFEGRNIEIDWLPSQMPPYIHMIFSSTPGYISDLLTQRINPPVIITIQEFTIEKAHSLINQWEIQNCKHISYPQRGAIDNAIKVNRLPLFLKLILQEAILWRSYDSNETCTLTTEIHGQIHQRIERLSSDQMYGQIFVSKCLAYLGTARFGISEDQLLNILSQDSNVMNDYKIRYPHSPDIDKLPTIIWSRFRFDLEPFLIEKKINDQLVLSFFHTQIQEVINTVFQNDSVQIHHNLADFFHTIPLSAQKMDELPWHLLKAGDYQELESFIIEPEAVSDVLEDKAPLYRKYEWFEYLKKCNSTDKIERLFADKLEQLCKNPDIEQLKLARYYNDYGAFLFHYNNYAGAEHFFFKGLNIRKREVDADAEIVIRSMTNVVSASSNLLMRGRTPSIPIEELDHLAREAYERSKNKYGNENFLTLTCVNNYSTFTLLKSGLLNNASPQALTESEQLLLEAIRSTNEDLTININLKTQLYHNLAIIKYYQNDFRSSATYSKQAIKLLSTIVDKNSPEIAAYTIQLGESLLELKDFTDAEKELTKGLDFQIKTYGPDCEQNLDPYLSLGLSKIALGKFEGIMLLARSFKLSRRFYPPEMNVYIYYPLATLAFSYQYALKNKKLLLFICMTILSASICFVGIISKRTSILKDFLQMTKTW